MKLSKLNNTRTEAFRIIVIFLVIFALYACSSSVKAENSGLPGVKPYGDALMNKLEERKQSRGSDYKPRTKHLKNDGSAKYTNRLFLESSPYLLQHAHNPVNWYPWGDEAFEEAKKQNLPVFVSIGYSTCHWCHVMEDESFESEEIAEILNTNFIPIKVDREERPDIDSIYMSAVQVLTGSGGWPLNVWMTPEGKPFYGGTYFTSSEDEYRRAPSFPRALKLLSEAYRDRNDLVIETAENLSEIVEKMMSHQSSIGVPDANLMHIAASSFKGVFDEKNGGLEGAPKFPSSLPVRFLLRYYRGTGEERFLEMAKKTLDKMAAGGIYDHIGGGFHRYSTDDQWLVPHFEKMLYDNALLSMDYLEGFQVTGDENYRAITEEILDYISKEMTSPEGGFYSATDADSLSPDGHMNEGYFFTWTIPEINNVLGQRESEVFNDYFSITKSGNFEGRSIPNITKKPENVAKKFELTLRELNYLINDSKDLLYKKRKQRPAPLRDDKIITAWNGLMISAFVKAGQSLDRKDYTERAKNAATFILNNMYNNGRLKRSFIEGEAKHNAYLEDYAFFTASLLDLFEITQNKSWLTKAIELENVVRKRYEDTENGGFFKTSDDHEKLIAREKPVSDGAIPSGYSIAVLNLLRLGTLTFDASYDTRAVKALKFYPGSPNSIPGAMMEILVTIDYFLDNPKEIVIVTEKGKQDEADSFLNVIGKSFIPNKVVLITEEGEKIDKNEPYFALINGRQRVNGKTTAYVCEAGVCKMPVNTPEDFRKVIEETLGYE
jgi:uncharacterized protein YyaL (SSP411 family)